MRALLRRFFPARYGWPLRCERERWPSTAFQSVPVVTAEDCGKEPFVEQWRAAIRERVFNLPPVAVRQRAPLPVGMEPLA